MKEARWWLKHRDYAVGVPNLRGYICNMTLYLRFREITGGREEGWKEAEALDAF